MHGVAVDVVLHVDAEPRHPVVDCLVRWHDGNPSWREFVESSHEFPAKCIHDGVLAAEGDLVFVGPLHAE